MKYPRKTRIALAALLPGSKRLCISAWVAAITIPLACTATLRGNEVDLSSGKVKVGVLHSLSGTMAISETTLKDTVLEHNSSSCDNIRVSHIPPSIFDLAVPGIFHGPYMCGVQVSIAGQILRALIIVSVVVEKTVQDVESLIVVAIGERGRRVVNSINNLSLG